MSDNIALVVTIALVLAFFAYRAWLNRDRPKPPKNGGTHLKG